MNVTSEALLELKKVIDSGESPIAGIRISSHLGCCGPALQMSVVEKPSAGDKQILVDAVNFYIDNQAEGSMQDVTIDFGANGFRFNNMKKSGGCCS